MIVFADRDDVVRTSELLREIEESSNPIEELIRFGQLEAGIVDALCPERDETTGVTRALRSCALDADYGRIRALDLPPHIRVRVQEGFAYYALHPEMYERAARRFMAEVRPSSCVTIGIRSIGTALSTVVQRVCGGESFTVRPHGHPFDRVVLLDGELPSADWYLVVDEGPGLSGSSFASVAEVLIARGVPEDRIVFFPSHDPDPGAFVSERGRLRWPRHRTYVENFDRDRWVPRDAVDLSGGLWRSYLRCDVDAVPQHERRKYLDVSEGVLWKWSGLGHYGRKRLERAEALREFTPPVRGLSDGFLLSSWVEGRPATEITDDLLQTMARYLSFLAQHFTTEKRVDYPAMREMIRVNTGHELPEINRLIDDGCTLAVDGRMLPHEWIETGRGWLKSDALDHHDDHFFPGCQDIAWDIAGAAIEFGFDPGWLAERYLKLRRDDSLHQRLPFYTLAYSAFRLGYCRMFGLNSSRYERASAFAFPPISYPKEV